MFRFRTRADFDGLEDIYWDRLTDEKPSEDRVRDFHTTAETMAQEPDIACSLLEADIADSHLRKALDPTEPTGFTALVSPHLEQHHPHYVQGLRLMMQAHGTTNTTQDLVDNYIDWSLEHLGLAHMNDDPITKFFKGFGRVWPTMGRPFYDPQHTTADEDLLVETLDSIRFFFQHRLDQQGLRQGYNWQQNAIKGANRARDAIFGRLEQAGKTQVVDLTDVFPNLFNWSPGLVGYCQHTYNPQYTLTRDNDTVFEDAKSSGVFDRIGAQHPDCLALYTGTGWIEYSWLLSLKDQFGWKPDFTRRFGEQSLYAMATLSMLDPMWPSSYPTPLEVDEEGFEDLLSAHQAPRIILRTNGITHQTIDSVSRDVSHIARATTDYPTFFYDTVATTANRTGPEVYADESIDAFLDVFRRDYMFVPKTEREGLGMDARVVTTPEGFAYHIGYTASRDTRSYHRNSGRFTTIKAGTFIHVANSSRWRPEVAVQFAKRHGLQTHGDPEQGVLALYRYS